jgi:excisionase family DNA binding protein
MDVRMEYVTTQEAARMLGYEDSYVRRLCRDKVFDAVKWGNKSWMIPTQEVMKHRVQRMHKK